MLLERMPTILVGRSFVHSLRFEILLVCVVGVLLPAAILIAPRLPLLADSLRLYAPSLTGILTRGDLNSLVGAGSSALVTIMVLRRFRLYPGTALARSILPVLASCYGAFLLLVVLLRLEYSNKVLIGCFVATLVARYAFESLRIRIGEMVYYLVPGGRSDAIRALDKLPVVPLTRPRLVNYLPGALIADLRADHPPEWERLIAEAAIAGWPVYHYKQVWEAQTGRVRIDHLSENSFGALVPSLAYQKFKRLVDLCTCLLVLPIVVPLMALTALLIRLDGPGAIFFRQRRMGFRGKVFDVIKFRTMSETNDGEDRARSVTLSDDQRITRVGGFLRRTRLDELPQIINIWRGEMSWIGPRPEAVSLSTWYEQEIPFYRYRHIVRPGITGWAQVNQGHVASLDEVTAKLQFDFYYVKNLSYWIDIIIALRTLRVVVSGFGAK
ncbi:sugar transferase [Qipengyuania sp. CAU 1752]